MNAEAAPQGNPVAAALPTPRGANQIHLSLVSVKPGCLLAANRPAYKCSCGETVKGTRVELNSRWSDPRLCPTCIASYQATKRHTLDTPLDCLLVAVQED